MCTQQYAADILKQAYTLCQKLYDGRVRDAYLYGSYARGDYHEESDVDIMMIIAAEEETVRSRRYAVSEVNSDLSLEHDITVSINVASCARFDRFSEVLPYYRNILKEGIRYEPNI